MFFVFVVAVGDDVAVALVVVVVVVVVAAFFLLLSKFISQRIETNIIIYLRYSNNDSVSSEKYSTYRN